MKLTQTSVSELNSNSYEHSPEQGSFEISPVSETCLLIRFGTRIDREINHSVHAAFKCLYNATLPGVIDIVPAFASLAIHYRPEQFIDDHLLPYQRLSLLVQDCLSNQSFQNNNFDRVREIPVCYSGDFAPDLEEVAKHCGLSVPEVIELHCSSSTSVYMIGFSPGLPYAGGLDSRLSIPRRTTPRKLVAEGTVAIANDQTAIYTMDSPGGWNLIGRTPLRMFNPKVDPPCFLQPGDQLRFFEITEDEYHSIRKYTYDSSSD